MADTAKIEAALDEWRKLPGKELTINPPCQQAIPDQIAGIRLPEDYRAFLAMHNGVEMRDSDPTKSQSIDIPQFYSLESRKEAAGKMYLAIDKAWSTMHQDPDWYGNLPISDDLYQRVAEWLEDILLIGDTNADRYAQGGNHVFFAIDRKGRYIAAQMKKFTYAAAPKKFMKEFIWSGRSFSDLLSWIAKQGF